MRFVMLLLLAAAGYYGWGWYQQSQVVQAAGPELENPLAGSPSGAEAAGAGRSAADPAAGAKASGAGGAQPLRADPAATLVAEVTAGQPEALRRAAAEIGGLQGELRQQVALALSARMAGAEGPEAVLAVLGDGNAFLHTAEGRKLVDKALAKLRHKPVEERVIWFTRLLERCADGPITKQDGAAFAMVNKIYAEHGHLVRETVCNPGVLSNARVHKVKPGELLDSIARRYRKSEGVKLDGWSLCILNGISSPRRLQAGQQLKIPLAPLHTKVFKRSYLLGVYVGEALIRLYWIGHGRDNCTPTQTFSVSEKIPEPTWYAPDGKVYPYSHPENPLGDYFIKLKHPTRTGFGVHGTTEPETLRTMASDGCIRMADADIKELFRLLPRGSGLQILP